MQTFRTPFSRAYWRAAASELKSTRMWVFAALIVALRVALKSVRIPILENLYVSVGFLPNALGSMIYGPVLAALTGLVSDVLGALLFPIGPFFPPFAVVEITGSVLFALFLYRVPVTVPRIALSKLSVNIICNIILTPIFLAWMQGSAAYLMNLPRIAKNVLLFPVESVLLALLIGALIVPLKQLHLLPAGQENIKLTKKHYIMLGALFVLAALSVFLYYRWFLRG